MIKGKKGKKGKGKKGKKGYLNKKKLKYTNYIEGRGDGQTCQVRVY